MCATSTQRNPGLDPIRADVRSKDKTLELRSKPRKGLCPLTLSFKIFDFVAKAMRIQASKNGSNALALVGELEGESLQGLIFESKLVHIGLDPGTPKPMRLQ